MPKIILDLCGGTGAWSKPYKDAGYDVLLITLPEYDVRSFSHDESRIFFDNLLEPAILAIPTDDIYGILAAPPCTEFSLAKTTAPRDFRSGLEIVTACLKVIHECRLSGKLQWWAMENPKGFLRQFMGKPPFTFEQWEFGDTGIKPTDLWGYYNFPSKSVSVRPEGLSTKYKGGSSNAKGWNTSAEKRAITPQGFAQAFYKANK